MRTTIVFSARPNAKTKRRAKRERPRIEAAQKAAAEAAAAEVERAKRLEGEQVAKVLEWKQRAAAWVSGQRAVGWPSYSRAVYALARLDIAWERSDTPPKGDLGANQYMRDWYKASRWVHSGLSPEDVVREIWATPI